MSPCPAPAVARRGAALRAAMADDMPSDVERAVEDAQRADRVAQVAASAITVVCDGWAEPRHARKVLRAGDPAQVSHGMCEACVRAMRG